MQRDLGVKRGNFYIGKYYFSLELDNNAYIYHVYMYFDPNYKRL
jgi:hypothetical protein